MNLVDVKSEENMKMQGVDSELMKFEDKSVKEEHFVESASISTEQNRSSHSVEKPNLIIQGRDYLKLLTCNICGCKAITADGINNQYYVCLICELRSKLSYSLNRPIRVQANDMKYLRSEQSTTHKIYVSKDAMDDILKKLKTNTCTSAVQEVEKKFSCFICEYNTCSRKLLEIHMLIHNTDRQLLNCKFCDYKTNCVIDLDAHKCSFIRKHSEDIRPSSLDKPVDGGQKEENDRKAAIDPLVNQINDKTTDDLKNIPCSSLDKNICKDTLQNFAYNEKNLYNSEIFYNLMEYLKSVCYICGYTNFRRSALKKHCSLVHNVDEPFVCRHCEYRTKSSSLLKSHLLVHFKEKPFTCHLCGFNLKDNDRMKKHLRTHINHKLYVCNVCEFKTTQSIYLRKHMIVHADGKPYSCDICDYKCKFLSSFNKHKRTHKNVRVKRCSCSFCPYKADEEYDIRKHEKAVHFEERPYVCTICEYRTACETRLKNHLRTHTNIKLYSCGSCEFKTNHYSSLIRHNDRLHKNESSYRCSNCSYKTASVSDLKLHTKRSHVIYNAFFSNSIKYDRNIDEVKLYACSSCNYAHTKRKIFINHVQTHVKN